MMEPIQFQNTSGEGYVFHEIAGDFLDELEFRLIDDPSTIRNPYQATRAMYRSARGLYLSVWTEPFDGNYVSVKFGRLWHGKDDWYRLSNHYAVLAKQFRLRFPTNYKLGYGDEIPKTMDRIAQDLKKTLPTILKKVTLSDLTSVEAEEYGAQQLAELHYGPDFFRSVQISVFLG